ncbi:hypothetical protein BM613_06220 [Sulfoacidibacillus thermotolerans]|uniref:DUF1146 domain-containing protein n=1 Tax=Sulfoacidibacillus thermotolerans TaxID=1765684 RepID=A0A2U3D9T1_SULT2|nr:hypothetical protein BM613_06220 [Sulfoacidibacillus thermotolerans]
MSFRVQGAVTIGGLLVGTLLAWYALGAVRWDVFLKNPESPPASLFRLLLAILIGTGIAGFVIQYVTGASMMRS